VSSATESDSIFPAEKRHESEVILKEVKQPYQINLYSGVEHGFAVRCEISLPQQKYAKESAFLQACAWFDEWL
jgi:sterol O-acyltransferase